MATLALDVAKRCTIDDRTDKVIKFGAYHLSIKEVSFSVYFSIHEHAVKLSECTWETP